MSTNTVSRVDVPTELVDAIRSFPTERVVEHCGKSATVSPFDFYYRCSVCGQNIKFRSFGAVAEIEDVFDAVFEWMSSPAASSIAEVRRKVIESDKDD